VTGSQKVSDFPLFGKESGGILSKGTLTSGPKAVDLKRMVNLGISVPDWDSEYLPPLENAKVRPELVRSTAQALGQAVPERTDARFGTRSKPPMTLSHDSNTQAPQVRYLPSLSRPSHFPQEGVCKPSFTFFSH
jgi:hypothetical protein